MNTYKAIVYGKDSATLHVRAASAVEAVKNLWVAIHGDSIGFNYSQAEQNAPSAITRDNAHAQWLGGHAGISIIHA